VPWKAFGLPQPRRTCARKLASAAGKANRQLERDWNAGRISLSCRGSARFQRAGKESLWLPVLKHEAGGFVNPQAGCLRYNRFAGK
jgi:hypothetical protein